MKKIYQSGILTGLVFVLMIVLCFASQIQAGSIPLEKGNYAEVTLGDLDKAINIYEKIVKNPQAGRDEVSEALYRLGLSHLKKGNRAEALVPLKKLVRNYPEQSGFIGKTKAILSVDTTNETIDGDPDSALVAKALPDTRQVKSTYASNRDVKNHKSPSSALTVSWPDGQIKKWRASHANSPGSYKSILWSANIATINGKKYWCFEKLDRLNKYYGRVFVDMLTHKPVFSYTKTGLRTIEVTYGSEEIELKSNHQGSERVKRFPIKGNVYDNLQFGFYSNPGNWEIDGYLDPKRIFFAQQEGFYEIRWNVIGAETVTVPAGTFDCYKVKAEVNYIRGWFDTNFEIWVSKKEKGFVKVAMESVTIELVETTVNPTSISSFQEGALESLFNQNI